MLRPLRNPLSMITGVTISHRTPARHSCALLAQTVADNYHSDTAPMNESCEDHSDAIRSLQNQVEQCEKMGSTVLSATEKTIPALIDAA